MKLSDLVQIVGSDDTPIVLLGHVCWLGTFPAMLMPKEYKDFKVTSIMPDENKGLCCDDMCLKVWVEDNG